MYYNKPEVAVLGDATSVILGQKQLYEESLHFIKPFVHATDTDLDN